MIAPAKAKSHLRVKFGKKPMRDSWKDGRTRMAYTACEQRVRLDCTAARPGTCQLTCTDCAVFADWLLEHGKPGQLTIRKSRALRDAFLDGEEPPTAVVAEQPEPDKAEVEALASFLETVTLYPRKV